MNIFLLRKSGCPNCASDKVAEVWSVEDFKTFEPLIPRGKLGKSTELFECSSCNVHYIRVNYGHLLHLLTKSSEELVFKFFDTNNRVTHKDADVLRNIGSPRLSEGNEEYPAKVLTKDGTLYEHAVVRTMDYIWPIGLAGLVSKRLISEIANIAVSDEAMTLEQRTAAYEAVENRSGIAPIWLNKGNGPFMTTYQQYFIPKEYGKPADFILDKSGSAPTPTFNKVQVTFFIGPN